jgi:hypothetical protein
VAIDRPDDAEQPSDDPTPTPRSAIQRETRTRQEYYDDLRAALSEEVRTGKRTPPDPASTPEPKPNGKPWQEVTAWSTRVWLEYQRKWPPEERPPADRPANHEIDEECDHIAKRERERISPAMLEIESRDPDRHLVGFEHRLKGRDRIMEKVADRVEEESVSPKEALSLIPDTIRYTFRYEETRYSMGVHDDIARLQEQGFKLVKLRNSWPNEQYKGINTQWMDTGSGQRFELQFHTRISFEAKQITHVAYERLRLRRPDGLQKADELERMVLKAFQREVSAEIPIPPGATDIPDYTESERNDR